LKLAAGGAQRFDLPDGHTTLLVVRNGSVRINGGAAVPGDYGAELVELIERTINPSFWDVAGGPGTIVYYRPLQCLVVRATAEVHGQVGGVLGDLRAAGK